MNLKTVGIVAAVVALFYWIRAKKNTVDNLKFFVRDIQPNMIGLTPIVNLNLLVTNPTAENLSINSVTGLLKLNGTVIGDVVSNFYQQVPAYQNIILPVQIRLFSQNLFESVKMFIQPTTTTAANFNFDGLVNFKGINFPISLDYKLI